MKPSVSIFESPKLWLRDYSRCRSVACSALHPSFQHVIKLTVPCARPIRALHSAGWGHLRIREFENLRGSCTQISSSAESEDVMRDSGSVGTPPAPQPASQSLFTLLAQASTLLPYAVLGSALLSLCVRVPPIARESRTSDLHPLTIPPF